MALFAGGGCEAHIVPPPKIPHVVDCETIWKGSPSKPENDEEIGVGVVLHLMVALGIYDDTREALIKEGKEPAWKLAPKFTAVRDTWTDATIEAIFGPTGKVNQIWKQAKIHLSLVQVDTCEYESALLRLDGRPRESMFTPESQMPWAAQLFRSINRLFTSSDPRKIHVVIWWSIQEEDVDGIGVQGYARSAAHGGPAVWADAYQCLRIPDEPSIEDARNYGGCGRLLAHEIGHTLGLQHVDEPWTNLMHMGYAGVTVTPQQVEQARREARQQFMGK